MMSFEFQESYLRSVLAFIGIVDVDFVRVEGIAMGEDAVRTALAHAQSRVRDLVSNLARDRARDAMRAAA